ncbi:FG-GAP repeat protein [Luedemannella flava]
MGRGTAHAGGCATRVRSDVNGDGRPDLAITQPFRTVGRKPSGALRVLFGTASGLTTVGNQYLDRTSDGIAPLVGDAVDGIGDAVATGFFDDDCYADVAVTVAGGQADILVLRGSASGLDSATARAFTVADVPGAPMGAVGVLALATGDVNGDGWDELALGVPGDGYVVPGGGVGVLYGSVTGLSVVDSQFFTQDSPGVPGGGEGGDWFGAAVVLADFNGDRRDDLAVGVPLEDLGRAENTGAVVVLPSVDGRLTGAGSQHWTQHSRGMPGGTESRDNFGAALAAGDVNHDGRADLAIAAPEETLRGQEAAGTVTVLRGSWLGLTTAGATAISQDTAGVPDSAEQLDMFGAALAFGDFNGDGYDDLAAGAPGERIGSRGWAGSVTVLYSDQGTVTGAGADVFAQSTWGVPGDDEEDDMFGYAVTAIAGRPGAAASLVVGIPEEGTAAVAEAGAVVVLKGGRRGLTVTGAVAIVGTELVGGTRGGGLGRALA